MIKFSILKDDPGQSKPLVLPLMRGSAQKDSFLWSLRKCYRICQQTMGLLILESAISKTKTQVKGLITITQWQWCDG